MSDDEITEFREVWFIYSPHNAPWANLRLATFTKGASGAEFVVIHNDIGPRFGVRVWDDIRETEGWFKVRKVDVPSVADVMSALMADQIGG
jgi:hypothetical protein